MKSITDALAQHLAGDTMTTARLWKIKRKATTEVVPVQTFSAGQNFSDPSCNQIEVDPLTLQGSTGTLGGEESVGSSYAVADLADNNTSAANSWANTSNGDAVPADVSKVPIKAALYPGASTRVLAHMVAWFNGGTNGHIDVGYSDYSGSGPYTGNATQIAAAIADMKSRGIDGVVLDWYGQGTPSDAVAGAVKTACETDGAMTFCICIDKGALGVGTEQTDFENGVSYVNSTYFGSSAYEKRVGRPLLLEFGCEKAPIDWTAVRSFMNSHGNPLFLWQDLAAPTGATGISGGQQNAFDAAYTDGAFSWVGVSAVTGGDPEALNYLKNFYNSAKAHPAKIAMGSVRKGFNDALASWGTGRVMTQANGDTWADSFSVLNGYFSSSSQLPYLQVVTWDDYEEGSEVETGIATNLAFGALSTSGNQIAWSTTGELKPFDHIGVYASSDSGVTYKFLGQIAKTATSVDLVAAFALAAGTYKVRLRAVGISSVQSVESADVTVTVSGGGGGGGAPTNSWAFVNGKWQTVSTLPPNSETKWLYAYGFGFQIPSNATIVGIVCDFLMSAQETTGSYIQEISLFNAQAPIGTEKTPDLQFTPSQQNASLGGKLDLWGAALTPALVNSLNFGFAIRAFDDGVELSVWQFAMTVYYTVPAIGSGSSGAGGVSLQTVSALLKHTNYTGGVQADTSNDATAKLAPGAGVFDPDTNYLYVCGNSFLGVVHYFDSLGNLLGTLGDFGYQVDSPAGGGLRIVKHPTFGKWLVGVRAPVNAGLTTLMCINAAGVSPGTLTNSLTTVDGGLSSGGNQGAWDVDTAGNIWAFTKAFSAAGPVLHKISFSDATHITIGTTYDFHALYGWTQASGCIVNPNDNSIVVGGNDAVPESIIAVINPTDGTIRLSSTTLLTGNQLPYQMGVNGSFILTDGGTIDVIQASTLTQTLSVNRSSYGIGSSLGFTWYDAANGFVWVRIPSAPWAVSVLSLANPTTGGVSALSDPILDSYTAEFPTVDHSVVSDHTVIVSPDGSLGMTSIGTGSVSSGGVPLQFISLWGKPIVSASGGGETVTTTTLGFTDHDLDILYDDGEGPVLYIARTGATFSAIDSKADMSPDNLDIDSFLESDLITEGDLRGGLYDGAECTVYLVNWSDLTQKHLTLRYGVFGKVKIVNGLFTTEIRGLAYALGLTIGDYYQPKCRAELFSTPQNAPGRQWYCNLNAALFQQTMTVASSADSLHIVPQPGLIAKGGGGGPAPATWFDFGLLIGTGGANQNLKFEIESWDGVTLTLYDYSPLAFPVAPGDTFLIEPGCDKTLAGQNGCIVKFNNAINHRGEPFIPGLDAVFDAFASE